MSRIIERQKAVNDGKQAYYLVDDRGVVVLVKDGAMTEALKEYFGRPSTSLWDRAGRILYAIQREAKNPGSHNIWEETVRALEEAIAEDRLYRS